MVVEPPQLLSSKLFYVSFKDPYQPLKPILALSSRNGIDMLEFDSLQTAIKLNPPVAFKKKWLWNPLQLLSSKLYLVSFQDPSQPLKPILPLSTRNGIYMLEFDSLQSAVKLNPLMTFKKKWLWNPLNYCPSNCTKFLFKIHISHSKQYQPYPQEIVLTCWSLIRFKLP